MAAVRLRFRADFRRRWRAWIGLGLLLGAAFGIVAAVAGGARRTDTAVARFHQHYAGFDVFLENSPDAFTAIYDPAFLQHVDVVASSARARFDFGGPRGNAALITPADGAYGTVIDRPKLLKGRLPNPARADEVVVATGTERELGTRLGGRVQLINLGPYADLASLVKTPDASVVGIVAVPNAVAIPRASAPGGVIFGTKALHDELTALNVAVHERAGDDVALQNDAVAVRLERGARDVPAYRQALEAHPHKGTVDLKTAADMSGALSRSLHLQAVVLWVLALALAVVVTASIAAVVRVSANTDEGDASVLQALGLSRAQFHALAIARGVVAGLVGAAVALVVASALSGRVLFGLARTVEPNEGVAFDWVVLGAAMALIVVFAIITSVITGALARRAAPHRTIVVRAGSTAVPTGVGVRFACTGFALFGRGIVGPAIGIAALTGALVFGTSLAHLRAAPSLYGWPWDLVVTNYGSIDQGAIDPGTDKGIETVRAQAGVRAAAVGTQLSVALGNPRHTDKVRLLTLDAVKGDRDAVMPRVTDGRLPESGSEIALGATTMRKLGVAIGDRIDVGVEEIGKKIGVTVVGRVVMPLIVGSSSPGDGALMPNRSTYKAFGVEPSPEIVAADSIYVALAPGANADTVVRTLNVALRGTTPSDQLYVSPRIEPGDLVDFGRVDEFPLLVGGVLALLAASTLVHVLVSSVRRRRKDLATLRALGLRQVQLGAIVAAQAAFLALVALAIGLPLGIVAGRIAWSLYADNSGFISVVRVPLLALLTLGLLTVLVAELCAAVPARVAARTRPATLLRTE